MPFTVKLSRLASASKRGVPLVPTRKLPQTSNLEAGEVVPMPTLPEATISDGLVLESIIEDEAVP